MLMKSELQELARKNAEVRVIIVNGFQIVGRIVDADESAVVIEVNGSRKVINVTPCPRWSLSRAEEANSNDYREN